MADNVQITQGTGTDVATDDCGAAGHTQIIKLAIATDGSATLVPADASGLQVKIASSGIAAGGLASGSVASGAIASGAIASGALAAGSIAAGAIAAGATSIADNEDAACSSGDRGVKVLVQQLATPADSAGSDGDYSFLQMSGGRLWVDASGKTLTVASHAVTNAGAFAVQTGAERAEDAAHSSGHTGLFVLAVRNDTPGALATTDGDYIPLTTDANGALYVTGGGGGTQYTEDAAAAANPVGNATILVRADALAGLTTTDGDNVAARGTDKGEQYVKHVDSIAVTAASASIASGAIASGAVASGAIASGAIASGAIASGAIAAGAIAAGATSIADNEDVACAGGDRGVKVLIQQLATPADSAADGDYSFPQMSAGRIWVDASGKTLTVASHAVTNAGTFVVQETGTWVQVDDAAFAPGTSKIAMIGAEFDDAAPDSVDEGDGGAVRMSANRNLYATLRDAAGNERGANINASNQLAIAGPVTVASAGIASGAIASGAVASGAVASGAVASGAIASGALAAGSIAAGAIADSIVDDAAFTPATSRVFMAGLQADETATDSVDEGDAGAARMTLDRKAIVNPQPHTAGGLTTFMASGSDGSSILVATKQTIKNAAGQLYGYYVYNPEAAVTFLHFYNTDTVTVGTTNPLVSFAIPAGSAANLAFTHGVTFDTAISCAATTTAGGNTAPSTGLSLVAWYK